MIRDALVGFLVIGLAIWLYLAWGTLWWGLLAVAIALWAVVAARVLTAAGLLPGGRGAAARSRAPGARPHASVLRGRGGSARLDAEAFAAALDARVIGQSRVTREVAQGIARRLAAQSREKPIFSAIFSGPTGVGKTELAKAIADALFAGAMLRVDCGGVIGEQGMQTLIGAPKGYVGSDSYGRLTQHLRQHRRSVLLFDEVEKAGSNPSAPLNKLLLSLLDEGRVTEQSDGSVSDARETVVLLTANAAPRELAEIAKRYAGQPEEMARAAKDTLRRFFAPELLGRVDLVATFDALSDEDRARICRLQLDAIAAQYRIAIAPGGVDAAFVTEALRRWETLEEYGVRELIRWLEGALADGFIAQADAGVREVRITFDPAAEKVTVWPAA